MTYTSQKLLVIASLLMAVMAMTSCTEHSTDSLLPEEGGEGEAVRFRVETLSRSGSSAVANGETFPVGAKIGLFGYWTGSDPFSATESIPNFFLNQAVEKTADDEWAYLPLKFWPREQTHRLTFAAYYPYRGTGIGYTAAAGVPHLTFAVEAKTQNQTDLMLSELVCNLSGDYAGTPVPLTFHHATAKVTVTALNENDDPIPFVATIKGLYAKATVHPTAEDPVVWTDLTGDKLTVFTTEGSSSDSERDFLMIPQPVKGEGVSPQLNITYEYYGMTYESGAILIADYGSIERWEAGKHYNYVFKVTHQGTDLSVSVNPWWQSGLVFSNVPAP